LIAAIGEPAAAPDVEIENPAEGQPAEGEGTAEEVAASTLPDDTQVEVEDPTVEGGKRVMTLKELRASYRHRAASDQKFTEADKARKSVASALENAKRDPASVLKWIETQRPDFKTQDFLFKQLEAEADPRVIDRLAQLLQAKLDAEEAEKKLSPADRRVKELEARLQEVEARESAAADQRVEQELFDGVKSAIAEAGLNPSPLVAIMALEVVSEARQMGLKLTNTEAALLLKDNFRKAAEGLFAPKPDEKPRGADGKFQAQAKDRADTAPGSTAQAAKRAAKDAAPRVSVVKPAKKKDADDEKPKSYLDLIRESYSQR
jgi:hypothetical protein